MLAGAGMNFVLGFVVMAILITAQNEPITSKVLYQVEEKRPLRPDRPAGRG